MNRNRAEIKKKSIPHIPTFRTYYQIYRRWNV